VVSSESLTGLRSRAWALGGDLLGLRTHFFKPDGTGGGENKGSIWLGFLPLSTSCKIC
jgi:hypothetical protein